MNLQRPHLKLYSTWLDKEDISQPRKNTVIYHCLITNSVDKSVRNIYIQDEPEVIFPQREYMLKNAHLFDYVLTWNDTVLKSCPNAIFFVFGGCWIHPSDREKVNPSEKVFSISTLVGNKRMGPGHFLRQTIYSRQKEITSIPYTFYRSSYNTNEIPVITNNPVFMHESKFELFRTFQFSLVIENSKETNYFTEKLIDCLITKTIPIYWGCPNIGQIFLTEGMILLETETFEEFNEKLAQLTPEFYTSKREYIEENYRRAQLFVSVPANIDRALKQIPNY
jgi:hypothetical protein